MDKIEYTQWDLREAAEAIASLTVIHGLENQKFVFLAQNMKSAKLFIKTVRELIEELPEWIRPKITRDTAREIDFEGGFSLVARIADPGYKNISGMTINKIFADDRINLDKNDVGLLHMIPWAGTRVKIHLINSYDLL